MVGGEGWGLCGFFCPRLARYGPAHGDPPARVTPVSAATRQTLSVFGTGDSKVVGSGPEAISPPGPTASDISLPVRTVGSRRIAYQRGAQAGAARRGLLRRHPHHPPNQIRQDPPGSTPHLHSRRHCRLLPAPRPISAQPILPLFLSQ